MTIDLTKCTTEELTKLVTDNNKCKGDFMVACTECAVFPHFTIKSTYSCATIAATALKELTKRGAVKF